VKQVRNAQNLGDAAYPGLYLFFGALYRFQAEGNVLLN
jgi:hypothetical protein